MNFTPLQQWLIKARHITRRQQQQERIESAVRRLKTIKGN